MWLSTILKSSEGELLHRTCLDSDWMIHHTTTALYKNDLVVTLRILILSFLFCWGPAMSDQISAQISAQRRLTILGWMPSAASIMVSRQRLTTGRTFLSASADRRIASQTLSMRRSSMSWIRCKNTSRTNTRIMTKLVSNSCRCVAALPYLVYNWYQCVIMLMLVLVELV